MKVLLDTNAYTALRKGHHGVVRLTRSASHVVFSTVVAGELLYGFSHGKHGRQNREGLQAFLNAPFTSLIEVGWTTADRFGRIAAALRKRGRPIPTNDIWIAAHALETGAELLTFDRHFDFVDGLIVHNPDEYSSPI